MICARCYSDDIGVIDIPDGRWVTTRDICKKCGFMIVITDPPIIRNIKIEKIKENVLRSTR